MLWITRFKLQDFQSKGNPEFGLHFLAPIASKFKKQKSAQSDPIRKADHSFRNAKAVLSLPREEFLTSMNERKTL